MVICGYVRGRNNYNEFVLTCLHCDNEVGIEKWQEFALHIKTLHKNGNANLELQQDGLVDNSQLKIEDCLTEPCFVDIPPICKIEDEYDSHDSSLTHFNTDTASSFSEAESAEHGSTEEPEEEASEDRCISSATEAVDTDNVKSAYTKTVKFHPTFQRRSPRISQFIELYKKQPCLWNPQHSAYKNKEKRAVAHANLRDQLKTTINVHLTLYKLKKAIASLHTQYGAILRQRRTHKLSKVPLYYVKMYSFLRDRADVNDESEEDSENDKIKLNFTETNELTTLFVNECAKFPQLYNPSHTDYSNVNSRKLAYVEIAKMLNANIEQASNITHYDVYESVMRLRQWYSRKIKGLSGIQKDGLLNAEKLYLDTCKSFFTTKTFRQQLICEICQQSFSTDHALQAHLYRAHKVGELPFKCEQCDCSFERRCHLNQHIQRVHIGKLFLCTQCDRKFAFSSQLSHHLRTHDAAHIEKPFVCEFCGKSFKQKIQMTNHVTAVHTKIRAYKCDIENCTKDFLTKRDLKDHIKAHLNIRDKVCEICQKAFTNANALIKHRHVHREKKLQCTLCSTRFSERVSLGVHMKRTHKIIRNNLKVADIK